MVFSFTFKLCAFAVVSSAEKTALAHAMLPSDAVITPMAREEVVHNDESTSSVPNPDDDKRSLRRAILEATGRNQLEERTTTSATVDPVRRVNARRTKETPGAMMSERAANINEGFDNSGDKSSDQGGTSRRRPRRRRRQRSKTTQPLAYGDDISLTQKPCEGNANCCQIPDAPYGTKCPNAKWVDAMVAADPRPGKVIMSIGCNKGNDAIQWMERWDVSEDRFWSTSKLIEHYDKVLGSDAGYSCPPSVPAVTAYTHRKKLTASETSELPIGICVEPMPANVELLRNTSAQLGYNKAKNFGSFHIVQAAVTHSATKGQTADFPDNPAGAETAKLWLPSMRGPKATVPVTTVDAIVAANGLSRIDVLTIDAEGADADVLKGATSALASVRYLEFEVHRDLNGTAWDRTTLASVVKDLHGKGFDCFWAGTNGKLVNMRECWRDDFERGHWGNAACVKRGDPWRAILQRFATA